jgi:Predicted Zn-dependent proteases and their inactivated homologs
VKRALSLGANYAEARYQLDYHEDVRLRNGHPVAGGFSVNSGIAVRVIVDGAMGFASTNRMKQNSVRNAVERSIALAKASAKLLRRPIEMSEEELGKDKVIVRPRVRFENVDLPR